MQNLNFSPFPVFNTKRLILRKMEISDAPEIFQLRTNGTVNRYIDRPVVQSIDAVKEFITKINKGIMNNEYLYWSISLNTDDKLIGTICLWNFSLGDSRAEIGYELHPDFHGKGIMNEAIEAVLKFGKINLEFKNIVAYTNSKNIKSINLLTKHNFIRDMEMEKLMNEKERRMHLTIYSLKDWARQ